MITAIWLDNFKSLVDFELNLAKFTCLVGLNGAGKSTVLQGMDLLAQLIRGDLEGWLERRQWKAADINSKLTRKSNIDFRVTVWDERYGEIHWRGSINRGTLSCTHETVEWWEQDLLKVEEGGCTIAEQNGPEELGERLGQYAFGTRLEHFKIVFDYQGSILSRLKDNQLNPVLRALKRQMLELVSLDLLSPELLRSRTKAAQGDLGAGGRQLSAFLHESGKEGRQRLQQSLSKLYRQLETVETRSLRSGWKQLEIVERFGDKSLRSNARHINDGMLRMMAVLAQLSGDSEICLFDEIENGINPEIIEFLMDQLVEALQQVLVTTHSPMILNYLEDEVAREGVIYLYKTERGYTRAIRMFDIPSMRKKLQFMGPGEVFVDTDLTRLQEEILALPPTTG